LNLMDSNLVMVDFSRNLLARILVLVAITWLIFNKVHTSNYFFRVSHL
jgi:hypothetical protein